MTSPLDRVVDASLPSDVPQHLGVAVSGGSDSMALLTLLQRATRHRNLTLHAVTVDHGLRPESAREAQQVAAFCARQNIAHDVLTWTGWNGAGNLQNAARQARYSLMADWARSRSIGAVALGHTLDDQAETVVMRLARSAGVDGLSAMTPMTTHHGLRWLRPMLGLRRNVLRDFLEQQGVAWTEDPSNEDQRFDRIRVRRALVGLKDAGVTPEALAQVAENLAMARVALEKQTVAVAQSHVIQKAGALSIDWAALLDVPQEIQRRLVILCLRWLSGANYGPRRHSLDSAFRAVHDSGSATLEGCLLRIRRDRLWVCRELKVVQDVRCNPNAMWDERWHVTGAGAETGLYVTALGASGLAQRPGWRDAGLPREALLVTPSLWSGDQLVSAPMLDASSDWHAILATPSFTDFITEISH